MVDLSITKTDTYNPYVNAAAAEIGKAAGQ